VALSLMDPSLDPPADVIRHRVDMEPGLSSRIATSGHLIIWSVCNVGSYGYFFKLYSENFKFYASFNFIKMMYVDKNAKQQST